MSEENQAQKRGKGGAKAVYILGFSTVFLAMAGTIVYLLVSRQTEQPETMQEQREELRDVVVTEDNVDDLIKQMEEEAKAYTPPGYYEVEMNFEWHFATGDAVSEDAYVGNPATNTNAVYFDLFLAEDEENPIYQSPVIPLGGSLKDIALDVPLEAGTHDCVLVYHLVDDDQNTLSTLRVSVTVIIEG